MANSQEHFFNNPKIQQLIIQFAFRIPVRKECSSGEKKALASVLNELDSGVFQLFDDPLQRNPGCLFQVRRQLPVGATTIEGPSFILTNDGFSFFYPLKVAGQRVLGTGSIDARDVNRKMLEWLSSVQGVINNSHCQRTGKIYEIALGKFSQSDKKNIFNGLFSMELAEIGELNLVFANYRQSGSALFNIQTNLRYIQGKLEDDFFINIRVDINNRNLFNTMDPRDIEEVWNFADSIIDGHVRSIIRII